MNTERICPGCHKTLPPDVPLGLCPECLIKAGFNTGTEPGAPASGFVPPPIEQIARLFPQLEVIELIGKGGMGAVYKARQPALDRFVALKILRPSTANDSGFAERFNREARALARLNHPNIVAVHDFGRVDGLHYLIMEFVDGANLREVECAGRLSPEQALSIVPQICEALQFAHNEGVVHRDIKPENLLLDKKGRLKITDFGIAKILGVSAGKVSLTGAKDVVGTPHYMAPEQIEKPTTVDHRADIYSLGVVFYEMLTGELPLGKFAAPSAKVQVDVRLDEVVLRALEKEPERRYQQASVLQTDVETIATTTLARTETVTSLPLIEEARRQVKGPAIGLLAAVGLQLVVFFALIGFAIPAVAREGNSAAGHVVISGMAALSLIAAVVVLSGATTMLKLRRHSLALVASVIAIVAGPAAILGLPFGIWSLMVLNRREVKEVFAKNEMSEPSRTGSLKSKNPSFVVLMIVLPVIAGAATLPAHFAVPIVVLCLLAIVIASVSTVGEPVARKQISPAAWVVVVGALAVACSTLAIGLVQKFNAASRGPIAVVRETIRNDVGSQLHEAGASYDELQVTVAEERDSATPFTVSYKGLRNFKYTHEGQSDPNWPISADGQFIMQYVGAGQWQGNLGDTQFRVQVGHTDNIDLPFVNDPEILGEWTTVDFVAAPSEFNPDRPKFSDIGRTFKGMTFLESGKVLPQWWRWTKGVVIHTGDKTASRYEIREIKGQSYLFMEWKNGGVMLAGMKPQYSVLKRASGPRSSPAIERVIVSTKDARIEGRGSADGRIIFGIGGKDAWSCGFLSDGGFTAKVSRTTSGKLSCTVKDADGNPLLACEMPEAGDVKFADGNITFHEGTPTPLPDGSFVVAEFQPRSGAALPFTVSVGKQLEHLVRKQQSASQRSTGFTASENKSELSFGVLKETVLKAGPLRNAELLDLDTGERATGTNFGANDRETHAWVRENKLDVLGVVEKGQIAVLCMDMVVVPAVGNRWEAITASDVVTNWSLHQQEPKPITGISPVTDKADTWLFQTREGGQGVLQILGQNDNPPGVKIRYKLVQQKNNDSASSKAKESTDEVIVEDIALRMLAAIRDKEDDVLKSLAVDRVKGYRSALSEFAFEMRERFEQMTGKPFDMWPEESLVESERAVVKCAGPKEQLNGIYVVLFFVKTENGWRNWSLRNSPSSIQLATFLKEKPPGSQADPPDRYTQDSTLDIQQDGETHFSTTLTDRNQSSEPQSAIQFVNSDFVNLQKIKDARGRDVSFTVDHRDQTFYYNATLNEPVPGGTWFSYTTEGTMRGLVKATTEPGVFEYRMRHWPSAGGPTRRIETHRLPAGAQVLYKEPKDLGERTRDSRTELFIDRFIPNGDSLEVVYRYRQPTTSTNSIRENSK